MTETRLQHPARTFERDDALPRVPLPDLEHTCERFVEWCAPLLDAEQLAATETAVRADLADGSVLRRSHDALVDYDRHADTRSWLDEFWRDRYLGRRDRIALNANFFFLLAETGDDQLTRAAGLVDGLLAHKALVDAEELLPLERRGQPLSMDQNRYLYSSTRIPGPVRDTARTPYSAERPGPSRSRRIVVIHRGRMALLDVLGDDGLALPLDVLRAALERTKQRIAEDQDWPRSVGALTSLPRADWARARAAIVDDDPMGAATLAEIEDALFCLVLDDTRPASSHDAGDLLLAGDPHDRWFDTSLTFVVLGDGTAGINGEHCELDGTTIASLVDFLAEHEPATGGRSDVAVPEAEPVELVLTDETQDRVDRAAADFTAFAATTTSAVLELDDLGSDAIKAAGVSPDAFVQAALQAARYRVVGDVGATYESIATRHWRAGRTEAMRVVTPEMVAFARAMADPSTEPQERRAALDAAATAHVERARQCQAGDAPEQHLWELQLLARRRGWSPEPALHSSPGWTVMRDDRLSTSAVPSSSVSLFGFGATTPGCVGVAYVLLPGRLSLYLSAPTSLRSTLDGLAEALPDLLREMIALRGGEA